MSSYISLFLKHLNRKNTRMSLIDDDEEFGVNEIKSFIKTYRIFCQENNLYEGQYVVVLGKRNKETVCFFHALLLEGCIPVLVDRTLAPEIIRELAQNNPVFRSDSEAIPQVSSIQLPVLSRENIFKSETQTSTKSDNRSGRILFVTHTSGTTGVPKLVEYSNKNISWAVSEYAKLYSLSKNRRVLFALPAHYCFGVIACCLSPLSCGGTVVFLQEKQTDPELIAQTIAKNKVNVLVINPFFYTQLCKIDVGSFDFSSLSLCDSGGETLPIEIIRSFQRQTNVLITEGYGQTETTSLTHFLTPDKEGKIRLGSVGKPCSDVICAIVDTNLDQVSTGTIGELLVRGPMVISSYLKPENNKNGFWNGWFRTGDLFYKDDQDFYYLVGRMKDAPSIPYEQQERVSKLLTPFIDISDIKDLTYKFHAENEVVLYIVPVEASFETRQKIQRTVLGHLPEDLTSILTIRFMDALPRTATGKVKKGTI